MLNFKSLSRHLRMQYTNKIALDKDVINYNSCPIWTNEAISLTKIKQMCN